MTDGNLSKGALDDLKNGKIIKRTINGFNYYFPKLINRPTTKQYTENCIYCKNKTFRYFSGSIKMGKIHYQCEKCFGIN